MAQPLWTKLDREQAHKVLEQLSAGNREAIVFSRDTTEVFWRSLPFYTNYRLYRLVNYATMPIFTMMYLSNEQEYISIDGTAAPIYTVSVKDPIRLTEMNVISYLEFFFSNVQGSEGDVFLITDPRKMPFMDTLKPAQQQSIMNCFKPLTVSSDSLGNFEINGTVHYSGGLMVVTIIVTPDGKMAFQNQSLLLSGIYLPDSPYSQAWLEG